MNDLSANSMRDSTTTFRTTSGAMLSLAVLVMGASLSGCADLRRASFLPPVNPESPVAAEVAVGARRSLPTPAFSNVPPSPKNVPTAPMVKTAVFTMVGCRRSFERWTRQNPAMVSDTEGFAAMEQAKVDSNPADVPTKADDEASQAYAEQMKAYASPPIALQSGPAPSASDVVVPPPKAAAAAAAAAPAPPKPAPPPAPKPARPAKTAAAPRIKPATKSPPAASAPPAASLAPVTVQAPSLAVAPPAEATSPAAASDPLLQHCQ